MSQLLLTSAILAERKPTNQLLLLERFPIVYRYHESDIGKMK
jgi:hypothetical protein